MQNKISQPHFLHKHDFTKNQLTNFTQIPNTAESFPMTTNPNLMGGSFVSSNKPLMVFSGSNPEYSIEDYLNAVTAK